MPRKTRTPVVKTEAPTKSPLELKANEALDLCKDKFNVVVILGLKEDGNIDVTSNLPQYPTMQWMLDRAKFELLIHEQQNVRSRTAPEAA